MRLIDAGIAAHTGADLFFAAFDRFFDAERIRDKAAAHRHHVHVAGFDGLHSLFQREAADDVDRNVERLFKLLRVRQIDPVRVVDRCENVGHLRIFLQHAAGNVDQVNFVLDEFRVFDRFLQRGAAGRDLLGADAVLDAQTVTAFFTDGLQHFDAETRAVVKTAAVFVGAVVKQLGKEHGRAVAVAAVDHDEVKSRRFQIIGCVGVVLDHLAELLFGVAGSDLLGGHAHFPAGVQLHRDLRPVHVHHFRHSRVAADQHGIGRVRHGVACSHRSDIAGADGHQSGAGERVILQVGHQLGTGAAVAVVQGGAVRRDLNAVFQGVRADFDRCKGFARSIHMNLRFVTFLFLSVYRNFPHLYSREGRRFLKRSSFFWYNNDIEIQAECRRDT